MKVGLTYDLRSEYLAAGYTEEETAEFDRDETIAALELALRTLGHDTDRIGRCQQLVTRLAQGDRWDLVFNIAEGMHGPGREAQTPALLDAYQIPYTFSDPLVMAFSLHKGITKEIVRGAGVPTPDFALVRAPSDIDAIDLPFPLFAKPVAEGTGKGVTATSKITNKAELRAVCQDLLTRFQQPVIVETFLPGREFTVAVLGAAAKARILGTMEIILKSSAEPEVYSYVNKEKCEELVEYRLVSPENDEQVRQAEELTLKAWSAINGRDAGRIDVRCDATGRASFIEVNPLAGMHPEHSDLPIIAGLVGMSFVELVGHIVESASSRIPAAATR